MVEIDKLLVSLGLNTYGLDAVYLQLLEIIGAIRKRKYHYANNNLDRIKLNIFWKTIREIANNEINGGTESTNAAINYVMDAFPDKKKKTDGRMWLPMHLAISVPDIDLDDIQIMFDSQPDCISQGLDQESNYTPCHLAMMSHGPDINLIKMLKDYDPGFGVRLTRNQSTPLHLAAQFSNSISVIQELIREFPQTLIMKDYQQRVPVACAFENISADAPEIFRILLQAAPQIVREPGNRGRFLLHQCLHHSTGEKSGNAEMVSIMLEAFPDAVNIADDDGYLPIQLAALSCGAAVFKMIVEANPANIFANHPVYGTVAHLAVINRNTGSIMGNLRYIHSIKPELFSTLNRHGNTPLAKAVKRHSLVPGPIKEIASLEPAAAIIVDNNGDNLLHMMIENNNWDDNGTATCDILRLFFRLIPGGALAVDYEGQTPYDLLDADNPVQDVARRLLLLAGAPSLHPETRQQMNYQARKGALFAFFAPRGGEHQSGGTDICHRIGHGAGAMEIIREIVSFL